MKRILIVLFACLLATGVLFGIAGITATNLFASGGLRGSAISSRNGSKRRTSPPSTPRAPSR